jgi:hypothetical protein
VPAYRFIASYWNLTEAQQYSPLPSFLVLLDPNDTLPAIEAVYYDYLKWSISDYNKNKASTSKKRVAALIVE